MSLVTKIRIFDIIISLIGLIILFPVFFLIFFLLLFDQKSPLFFQKRVGFNLKNFTLIKFRTMKISTLSKGTHLVDQKNITVCGHFLRKFKLDEFPQLLNVIMGDMSLVGPRPCLLNQKKLISERKKRGVFEVRPGITGLAQISGIDMRTYKLLSKLDHKMIKEMNLYKYFYYIFKTIFKFIL
jgi:lipopolysaccharide/colanic/teichoic acid biosynthesis glycosyltransferase